MMGKQMAFYIDQEHCSGCCTCQTACKDKNNLAPGQLFRSVSEFAGGGYRQIGGAVYQEVFAYWVPMSCNHCQDPLCVSKCPVQAIYKREEDGIVMINAELCIGCRICVRNCPYGAPNYNPITRKAEKCEMCQDQLAAGKQPVCVNSCPLRLIECGPLEELQAKHGTVNQIEGLPDAQLTRPSLVISPHRSAIRNERHS
ncbi:anaerobic dimethyl sulfoxide reductase subunit B (DMSO reductase iron-sulfur subunit) [Paenibacillus sophorae]|uniref:Anaerobic dimethyl sulfoxide reductase subunit B (DMSO reductase iron-sulfur subunit) n=1 Tax=Paenibacillus sophorae TaxID=1333845 RepID=A0A1H8T2L1_9BACL|nr:DMSO/selenate family reductase complex B subunit [Paenibacillus sophorae]QWU17071.1 dimethylsulfoxide reductase subunit B [Paenibacillus sophorae]SEO85299.1 anaerobic dimethyl sulfoxide reductase subunit B (DMSO reductase iron-sulfur subunit) [Paenibacillus sophorae]